MANYSFNWTSLTFSETDGVVSVAADVVGNADGFGTVLGTVTFRPASQPSGTFDFVLVQYPEEGDGVISRGQGDWKRIAGDRWSTSGTSVLSNGDEFKHEGEINLGAQSWSGTFG